MKPTDVMRTVFVLAVSLALAGCSDGPDIVPVKGKMTRAGKPLANFAVTFQPTKGRPSVGYTDKQGNFELTYTLDQKGAVRGKHKVYVQYTPMDVEQGYESTGAPKSKPPADLREIHGKYGGPEISPLEVEVNGEETLELKLD